jgi:hypothetical protein
MRRVLPVFATILLLSSLAFPSLAYSSRLIDFRLSSSRPQFTEDAGYSPSKLNAGVDVTYHFFVTRSLAVNFMPGVWLSPLKAPAAPRLMWYQLFISTGLTLRPLDSSWFDPTLVAQAGVGFSKAGGLLNRQANFPLTLRASFNLFRMTDQFDDLQLALVASGGASHVLQAPPSMSARIYDFGLGLRGTF